MDISNEFEDDMRIDPNALDVEILRQEDLFYKWSKKAVEAKSDVKRAKLALDVTKARLTARMIEDPDKYNLNKTTVQALEAAVLSHSEYLETYDEYLEAEESSSLLDIAAKTIRHKKESLQELVRLHAQQWFAGPSMPRNLEEIWLQHTQQQEEKLITRHKKRTRVSKRSKKRKKRKDR